MRLVYEILSITRSDLATACHVKIEQSSCIFNKSKSFFKMHVCVLRLLRLEGHRQLLTTELVDLQEEKKQIEQELKTNSSLQASTVGHCNDDSIHTS